MEFEGIYVIIWGSDFLDVKNLFFLLENKFIFV